MRKQVQEDLFKADDEGGLEAFYELRQKFDDQMLDQTSWSSNRTNARGGLFTFKSDELDVESLWQVQPDLKN